MKIGKKSLFVGLATMSLALAVFLTMNGGTSISASEEKYQLNLKTTLDDKSTSVDGKLLVNSLKETVLTFKATNTENFNGETFIEQLPKKYQDKIQVIEDDQDKGLTVKLASSSETYDIPVHIYFSEAHKKNGKPGKFEVFKDKQVVASEQFDLPDYQEPSEIETVELPQEGQSKIGTFSSPILKAFQPPTVAYTEVSNWVNFIAALKNPDVQGIRLTANLTAASITAANAPNIARNVVIDGNGHTITYTAAANQLITIGAVSEPTTLTIMNLEYNATGNSTSSIFTGSASNPNWVVDLNNVNTGSSNSRPFISLPGATVNLYGDNNWTWNYGGAAQGMIMASKINLYGGLTYSSNNANGNLIRNTHVGAEFNMGEGSSLTVDSASSVFNSTGAGIDVTTNLNSATLNLTKLTDFITSSSTLTGQVTNTKTTIGNQSGSLYKATGAINVNFLNSPIEAKSIGSIVSSGANATAKFVDSQITVTNISGAIIAGATSNGTFEGSPIKVTTEYGGRLFQVNTANSTGSSLDFTNSDIYLRQATGASSGFYINGATNLTFNNSSMDVLSQARFMDFTPSGHDSSVNVTNGSIWNGYVANAQFINTGAGDTQSPNFKLNVDGPTTALNLSTESTQGAGDGGIISITGANSEFYVTNGAQINLNSLKEGNGTPALVIQSNGGGFYISDESKIKLSSVGDSTTLGATFRFRSEGNMTFDLSNKSLIDVRKKGRVSAIRMYGGDNKMFIKTGSDFIADQISTTEAASNGGDGNSQQAIQYRGSGNNQFTLQDKDSNVSLTANRGPAIDAQSNLAIEATDDTYFVARGRTSGVNNGIFNAGISNIKFGKMKYFDFTNTRPAGGQVLTVAAGSTFNSSTTDLALWKRGSNISNNPDRSFVQIEYALSGANLGTWVSGDEEVRAYLASNGNLPNITRMNGNNQSPVIDELRVPTDADKYIYGHASVPEGKGEASRDAWLGEATVVFGVYKGEELLYKTTGTIVEDTANSGVASVYGDDPRGGIFKMDTQPAQNFLEKGQTIKILEAWRGDKEAGKAHISDASDFTAPDRTVLDVTPPKPTKLTDENLNNATKVLSGSDAEPGVSVVVYYDNGNKDTGTLLGTATVQDDGNWSFDLPKYIEKTKELSVYLEDKAGQHTAAQLIPSNTEDPTSAKVYDQIGLIKPPATNLVNGNINPHTDINYHDAVFTGVKKYQVADVLPDQPSLTKTVTSSGGTTTTVGDILTYTIVAGNNKGDGFETTWKDVEITDEIPEGLLFEPENHGITVNGTPLTDTSKFKFIPETKTLSIKAGDLLSGTGKTPKSVNITFNVKVDVTAVGKKIFNTAKAAGTTPREQQPFVPGINPNPVYEVQDITVKDNGTPGNVLGTLQLKSAPESIDFGRFASNKNNNDIRVDDPTLSGEGLVISDTRNPTKEWELYVRMKEPFKNADAPTDPAYNLPDAIVYRKGKTETPITGTSTQILSNNNSDQGQVEYDVSAGWTKNGDGIKLRLPAGSVNKLGKYKGVLEFKIQDAK